MNTGVKNDERKGSVIDEYVKRFSKIGFFSIICGFVACTCLFVYQLIPIGIAAVVIGIIGITVKKDPLAYAGLYLGIFSIIMDLWSYLWR